ncbi:hypothetical protein FG386_000765 [Cryptosporidium ryanae]|uniref:uncharacterized protein n=1 Tax=Cryptosporidium ryanae TaxID=515981 RepID=UPI00351A814B|nr:hypothetical protein FG386_000765 [Cryptosporidium ryanae]
MITQISIFFIINLALSLSEKALSSYGCYSVTGPLPPPMRLLKSTTPVQQVESESENLSIICISLVEDAELKSNVFSGQNIDMSGQKTDVSLLLQKKEILTGLYSSSLEQVIVSTCSKAVVYAILEPNTKLIQFQTFLAVSCMEVVKYQKPILRAPLTHPNVGTSEIDFSKLGMGIPLSKRPYECRFDSPTFLKNGNKINYKKKLIKWSCSSKVEKLIVLTVHNSREVTEKALISFVSSIDSQYERFVVKSPCNGVIIENFQGIFTFNELFLRIECIEDNIQITLHGDKNFVDSKVENVE